MTGDRYQIKLTPGGFPDLLSANDPDSPRTVAVESMMDRNKTKETDDDLLDELLESEGEEDKVVYEREYKADRGGHNAKTSSSRNVSPRMDVPSMTTTMKMGQGNHHYNNQQERSRYRDETIRRPIQVPVKAQRQTSPVFYKEEEKKEDDRVEQLRNEFDRQAYTSVGHDYYEDDEEEEEEEEDYEDAEEEYYEDEGEYEDEEGESGDDVSVSSGDSAVDLLERAHDRLHMQQLVDEVEDLKKVVERKNVELENLTGQLRRAVATKCDLVLAHTELELHHENNIQKKEIGLKELGKVNRGLLEEQSMIEIELLNEIAQLTQKLKEKDEEHLRFVKDLEVKHKGALSDWERIHKAEIGMKNNQIAKLQEEIRILKGGSPASAPQQKKTGLMRLLPL